MIRFPFRGPLNLAAFRSLDPETKYSVLTSFPGKEYLLRRGDNEPFVNPIIAGASSQDWQLLAGGKVLSLQPECKSIEPSTPRETSKSSKPAKQQPDKSDFCLPTPNDNYARLRIGGAVPKMVVLKYDNSNPDPAKRIAASSVIKLPDEKPAAPKPELTPIDQYTAVRQFDSVCVTLNGRNLGERAPCLQESMLCHFNLCT